MSITDQLDALQSQRDDLVNTVNNKFLLNINQGATLSNISTAINSADISSSQGGVLNITFTGTAYLVCYMTKDGWNYTNQYMGDGITIQILEGSAIIFDIGNNMKLTYVSNSNSNCPIFYYPLTEGRVNGVYSTDISYMVIPTGDCEIEIQTQSNSPYE